MIEPRSEPPWSERHRCGRSRGSNHSTACGFRPLPVLVDAVGSLAYVAARDWGNFSQELPLVTAGLDRMRSKEDYYGIYRVSRGRVESIEPRVPR